MFSSNTSQVSNDATYIEDVFSTYLYTGAGGAVSINNGIDFAGKGGMVWFKDRARSGGTTVYGAGCHLLYDTNRGVNSAVSSNLTNAANTASGHLTAFNSNGFSLAGNWEPNTYQSPLVSWSFRKQPKFFDVVTWTQPSGYVDVPHSLGSVPGCIIVKNLDNPEDWYVYHRSLGVNNNLNLNTTGAGLGYGVLPSVTATTFNSGMSAPYRYVAYLFAHDAGGFGLTGTDNVISCGSYTGTGAAGNNITLGYEPQWLLVKKVSDTGQWYMLDNMRGMPTGSNVAQLIANLSNAETSGDPGICPTATGFSVQSTGSGYNQSGATYIYIAIRRGPMKTPTSGTSVFAPYTYTGDGASTRMFSIGLNPVDMVWQACRSSATYNYNTLTSRLQGTNGMTTAGTGAEFVSNQAYDVQTGIRATGFENTLNQSGQTFVMEGFRRAPGFMDEVCYSGLVAVNNTTPQAVAHNLGVSPELVIVKCRNTATVGSTATNWVVCTILGGTYSNRGYLNTDDVFSFSNNLTPANGGSVSASNITFGYGDARTNASGNNYVAYLFASCPGVSKVGTYVGTEAQQDINCGFSSGARFVLVKAIDDGGAWYLADTARGITTGNDPTLRLNTTDPESNTRSWVDPLSQGFRITADAGTSYNKIGITYLYLAIA